jgi:hypothetical protein
MVSVHVLVVLIYYSIYKINMGKNLTKKQIDKNNVDQAKLKKASMERNWARGNKTSTELDILSASKK